MSRIRANLITNQSADGAPTVQNGLVVSGVTTSSIEGNVVGTGVSVVGVITATSFSGDGSNFKTGTTNVHNVGVEAAGINVLGADTPIGAGATIFNSGDVVSKAGAEFQGLSLIHI